MVGPTYPHRGGIVHYTHALLEALSALPGVDVELHGFRQLFPRALYRKPDYHGEQSVPLPPQIAIHADLVPYNPLTWRKAGARITKTNVVHFQYWTPFLAPSYADIARIAVRQSIPTVVTVHNIRPHERAHAVLDPFARRFLRRVDGVIVHSTALVEECVSHLGVAADRVHVIPHGAYTAFDKGAYTRDEARAALGLRKGEVGLLQFGTIRQYKGLDVAVRALSQLPSNFKLIVAGEAWEPWEKYESLIEAQGVSDRVLPRIGYIPDNEVELFFRAADVALFPYRRLEAQSGAASTALAFGLPLVVSRVGGLASLPEHAAFVEPGDVDGLSQAIRQAATSASAGQPIADELRWDAIARRTMKLYHQVVR